MLGKGPTRIYNIVSLVFLGLSGLFAVYVLIRLIAGQ
jgi:hypothetical protein